MQIIRKDTKTREGKDVFVEVVTNSFSIGKVQINFVRNSLDNKQEKFLPFYIDLAKAETLFNDVLNGSFLATVESDNTPYKKFFMEIGGIPFHKVNDNKFFNKERFDKEKKRFSWLTPNKDLSRTFYITKGNKYPIILNGCYQLGHLDGKNGLIIAEGQAMEYLSVPLMASDLKEIAISVLDEIRAFRTARAEKFFDSMYSTCENPEYIKE